MKGKNTSCVDCIQVCTAQNWRQSFDCKKNCCRELVRWCVKGFDLVLFLLDVHLAVKTINVARSWSEDIWLGGVQVFPAFSHSVLKGILWGRKQGISWHFFDDVSVGRGSNTLLQMSVLVCEIIGVYCIVVWSMWCNFEMSSLLAVQLKLSC
jgi:hypothetical protein